jgi:hypothetical protein
VRPVADRHRSADRLPELHRGCIAFAERDRDALAHQLLDVGDDDRFHGGEMTILKGGWFGLL